MAIDSSRLEKLISLQKFLYRHIIWYFILWIISGCLFSVLYGVSFYSFERAAVAISLTGERNFGVDYSIFEWWLILLITESGILWVLYFLVRSLHILSPVNQFSRKNSWTVVLKYTSTLQLIGFIVYIAFWKQSLTSAAHLPYLFNAFFHSVMTHAGSAFNLWPDSLSNPLLKDYALLRLAVTGFFLVSSLGFIISYDLTNLLRLRTRMKWPKRNWLISSRVGLISLVACLVYGVIINSFFYSETPLVTKGIDVLYSTCGIWGNFFPLDFRYEFGYVLPNTVIYIVGSPYGSPYGMGAIALIMFFLMPSVKRTFAISWQRALGYSTVAFIVLFIIYSILAEISLFQHLKDLLLALRLPLTIMFICGMVIRKQQLKLAVEEHSDTPTHSTESPQSGPS